MNASINTPTALGASTSSSTVDLEVAAGTVSAGQLVSMNMEKVVAGLPKTTFSSTTASTIAAAPADGTQFVVAYRDEGDGGQGKFWVGDSATGAQVGNTTTFSEGNVVYIALAMMPSTSPNPRQFLIAYQDLCDGDKGKVVIGDAGGGLVLASTTFTTGVATPTHA